MTQRKCKTKDCNGLVPADGASYWQYCNACGMKMRGSRTGSYTSCTREGCENPVSQPYYRFCQKCFYDDAQKRLHSHESLTQEELDELEQENEAERAYETMVEESREVELQMHIKALADIGYTGEEEEEEEEEEVECDTDIDLGYLEDDERNSSYN